MVDYEYLKTEMKILGSESGKDPENTFRATCSWIGKFMKRNRLSVQVKTGKKHRPTAELLPRMKNFHRHSIYQMAYLDPWVCFDIQFLRISGIFWKIWKHAKILFNLCGQIFENENLGSKTHGRSILKTAVFDMGLRHEIYMYCIWNMNIEPSLENPRCTVI